jgi:RNA polymerase sigma-70 factor (ECF subfamily)
MTLPETRHSLFVRLQDAGNHDAWREFLQIYEPAVYRFARRRGLQDADARELAQEVLTRVVQLLPTWDRDPARGTFRCWLFTVARRRVIDVWRETSRRRSSLAGDLESGFLNNVAMDPPAEDFDIELRRQTIRSAAERIRSEFQERTWLAFWRTSIEGEPIERTSRELGLSIGGVYAARSRVLARLKEFAQRMWADWESNEEVRP